MARLTPPVGTSGIYELAMPFQTRPLTAYTCKAVRTFDDIYKLNHDVLNDYYLPNWTDPAAAQAAFEADKANDVYIITLMSNQIGIEVDENDLETIIYVPDSYILKFPDSNNVPYSNIILSVALGALPDYLDLMSLILDMSTLASNKTGVNAAVLQHKAPSTGIMTPAQHDAAEIARQSAIIDRTTTYSENIKLQKDYEDLSIRYRDLEAAYIALTTP